MTGCLQRHARKYSIPIDSLKVDFELTDTILNQEVIAAMHEINSKELPSAYKGLTKQEDGVYVHGMFLDAGRIDLETKLLVDPIPGNNLVVKYVSTLSHIYNVYFYVFLRRPLSSPSRYKACTNYRPG